MSTALTTIDMGAELRALILADTVDNSALREGIAASFPVMSFRGKVWRVRYQGEAKPILMDGDPVPAILCVIVQANPQLSKLYYKGAYEEGSSDAPTCFSLDGVKPDASSENVQCTSCAACPHNVWGSKITPQGTKTKACSDSRRVAVVPYPDLANEAYGGPMLLRVPPASFKELVRYSSHLDEIGGQFSAVVTRIGFDLEAAFPKLVMREVRALSADEYRQVIGMRDMETVERMLSATESQIADVAPDPGVGNVEVQSEKPQPSKPVEVMTTPEPDPVPEEDDEEAVALAAAEAMVKKAKAAKAAKTAALPTSDPVPTASETAATTGVEVPAELASLLSGFNA
jgi:hypothetical protein